MPKQVIAGSNVSACMTLHSVKLPAEVKVDLLILGEHYVTQKNLETGNKHELLLIVLQVKDTVLQNCLSLCSCFICFSIIK